MTARLTGAAFVASAGKLAFFPGKCPQWLVSGPATSVIRAPQLSRRISNETFKPKLDEPRQQGASVIEEFDSIFDGWA
jgi:hypothetical protein